MTAKEAANVLAHLPEEEREVLILSKFYGLARDEIAGIIGSSVDVVDALMSRAVADLRRVLTSGSMRVQAA